MVPHLKRETRPTEWEGRRPRQVLPRRAGRQPTREPLENRAPAARPGWPGGLRSPAHQRAAALLAARQRVELRQPVRPLPARPRAGVTPRGARLAALKTVVLQPERVAERSLAAVTASKKTSKDCASGRAASPANR